MAQAVPTASWVQCLEGMPLGWHFSDMDVDRGAARFWLDSDRDGMRAIEIRLTRSCFTSGSTEIPSDRPEMRRLERVSQVTPLYLGRRYYLFDGGCITVVFRLSGENRGEPLAVPRRRRANNTNHQYPEIPRKTWQRANSSERSRT